MKLFKGLKGEVPAPLFKQGKWVRWVELRTDGDSLLSGEELETQIGSKVQALRADNFQRLAVNLRIFFFIIGLPHSLLFKDSVFNFAEHLPSTLSCDKFANNL